MVGKGSGRLVPHVAENSHDPSGAQPLRFNVIYREHARYVWRVARAIGVSDLHVDDVVHDVFLVVRRRLPDFDPQRSMRAWLGGITRRVVGHLWRGQAREQKRLQALPDPVPADSPFESMRAQEAQRLVSRFVESLDPDKRLAFVLMDVEGLTAKEVATACQSNPRTIYSRVRAARALFAKYLEEVGPL
ncbi:MAG: sigma-70 family RNA polymerase sigma factor [Nannocystaceae bacterium]|nr:sigma-70 family RNA polymerase sigma factor [Nannocystaceae bacterium]